MAVLMRASHAMLLLWVLFILSWWAAAAWTNNTEKRVNPATEIPYRILLIGGILLFAVSAHGRWGGQRLWQVGRSEVWLLLVLQALGLVFCWYARLYLGRLWSANITRKAGHKLIESGPYAIVRHPIYTGLILAFLATGAAEPTAFGLLGTAMVILSFWLKARMEEAWLSNELGADDYDGYRRRVPMLLPFGPKSRSV